MRSKTDQYLLITQQQQLNAFGIGTPTDSDGVSSRAHGQEENNENEINKQTNEQTRGAWSE